MNTFGTTLRLTTFGESHGAAIGGVIDGFPPRIKVDFDFIERRMAERRPGQPGTTQRKEDDRPEFLSGISPAGITLGTPIGFIIRNKDTRSADYTLLATAFRPNHADYAYQAKYGIRDHCGGGRASARETACRVVAGALAEQFLLEKAISIESRLVEVGSVKCDVPHSTESGDFEGLAFPAIPDVLMAEIEKARMEKDSIGGVVECVINGVTAGLGNPLYDKLSARLAYAMMSINAAKGFEIGDGFALARTRGSEVIDEFYVDDREGIKTHTNHNGGILGGISSGMPINFRVGFKPTPTIGKPLPLLTEEGEVKTVAVPGRHDPCVAVRAVPVVRAMAALVIADFLLQDSKV